MVRIQSNQIKIPMKWLLGRTSAGVGLGPGRLGSRDGRSNRVLDNIEERDRWIVQKIAWVGYSAPANWLFTMVVTSTHYSSVSHFPCIILPWVTLHFRDTSQLNLGLGGLDKEEEDGKFLLVLACHVARRILHWNGEFWVELALAITFNVGWSTRNLIMIYHSQLTYYY